jgi:arginine:pyruvate transaminase
MADRTLVVGSMSKSHAMTGSRCGWIVGPADAIAHLITWPRTRPMACRAISRTPARFALDQGTAMEDADRRPLPAPPRPRRWTCWRASTCSRAIPPDGAMYLMLDVRRDGLSGTAFAEALLDETEAIAVMPGESFGSAAAGHIRVAMTLEDAAFIDALDRLCAFAAGRAQA